MPVIEFRQLTKDYGNGKGVFDVTFEVPKGEVFGYLGPNGAGKTTSIRHLLGFLKPDSGEVLVEGKEVFRNHYLTNRDIGYLPGEIAFPEKMTGTQVLEWNRELKKIKDTKRQEELIEYFELRNLGMKVQRMSKGMKQKLGIICAFLSDPAILVLDEPTTGLDPLMQHKFISLVNEEKRKGKTILLSTHIFSEVERTCDRVAIIKNGRIAEMLNINDILHSQKAEYRVLLREPVLVPEQEFCTVRKDSEVSYHLTFDKKNTQEVLRLLATLPVAEIEECKTSIEDNFMKLYSSKEGD